MVQFLLLAFVLIVPFWLIGAATGLMLLPGLPVAALATFCPATAALIVVYREGSGTGIAVFLKKSFSLRSKLLLARTLLVMPVVSTLSFGQLRVSWIPVPAPQISLVPALSLSVAFFVAALEEELGWSGYAIDPMQARWGALGPSILLGSIGVIYHAVGLAQANRSVAWIAWWSPGSVALRVIIGSTTTRARASSPHRSSIFQSTSPGNWFLSMARSTIPPSLNVITAVVAAFVAVVWGSRTLAENRFTWKTT